MLARAVGKAANTDDAGDEGQDKPETKKKADKSPFGALDAMRKQLIKLGAVENRDPKSPFYDFRFALSRRDLQIPMSALSNKKLNYDLVVNFVGNAGELTTKTGLLRNLEAFMPIEKMRLKNGIQHTYDLSDMRAVQNFTEAYQKQQCRSLLFQYYFGQAVPQQELQLKIAWNALKNPEKLWSLSKEYWKILQQPAHMIKQGAASGAV